MRKKLLCVMMAVAVASGSVACGAKTSGSNSAVESSKTEAETAKKETREKTEAETTKAETEAPTEKTEEETSEEKDSAEGIEFQTGSWDGLTFTNPWLNVVITLPEDSYIFSEDDIKTVLGAGQDILINNGNYTETQMSMAKALTVYDFMASFPDGQSNVQLAYENIRLTTGGKGIEPKAYLDIITKQLTSIADMQYELGDTTEVEIAGQTFTKLSATLMGGAFCQDYYCIRIGDHIATMTFSYLADSASVVEDVVAGIVPAQ